MKIMINVCYIQLFADDTVLIMEDDMRLQKLAHVFDSVCKNKDC